MRRKILIIYGVIVLLLFIGVGILARQRYVGADTNSLAHDTSWIDSCTFNASPDNGQKTDGIMVVCQKDEGIMTTSAMFMGDGIIWLKDSLCASYGIVTEPGQPYAILSKSQLKQNLFCSPDKVNSAQDISNCCALSHEVSHACTAGVGSDSQEQMRCSEVPAGNVEATCRNVYLDKICINNPLSLECMQYCTQDAVTDAASKIWDACMCNESVKGAGSDGATCCSCLAECKDVDRIKNLLPNYCIANNLVNLTAQEGYCNFISEKDRTHNCDAYNNSQQDNQGNSLSCSGGTGFDPAQCSQYRSNCYIPQDEAKDKELMNFWCKETFGSDFLLNKIFQTEPEGIHNCTAPYVDRSMGYSCIKSTCDLHTSSQVSIGVSSGSITGPLAEKASAAGPISGVTIKVQKDRGPYSVTDNAMHNLGTTDTDGRVKAGLLLGSWKITAEKAGYQSQTKSVVVSKDQPFSVNFVLVPIGAALSQTPTPVPTVSRSTLVSRTATVVPNSSPTNGSGSAVRAKVYLDSSPYLHQYAKVVLRDKNKRTIQSVNSAYQDIKFTYYNSLAPYSVLVAKDGYKSKSIPLGSWTVESFDGARLNYFQPEVRLQKFGYQLTVNTTTNAPIAGATVVHQKRTCTLGVCTWKSIATRTTDSGGGVIFTAEQTTSKYRAKISKTGFVTKYQVLSYPTTMTSGWVPVTVQMTR